MSNKLNFFDGFTSSTEPTIGNIVASSVVTYADDAAYEAAEDGAPQAGNFYYNETSCKIRYYDHKADVWKDSDDESLQAIAVIIAEQLVQDGLIADNATDIADNRTLISDIEAVLNNLEIAIMDLMRLNNQDRNLATIGGGKITFGSTVAPGQSTPLDQNLNIDNHTAISDQSGFTHTPQSDGTIESYEIQFTMGTAPDGTLSVSLYTVDANGFPDTLLETSDVSDITTWNPGQTPTDVIFTLANPVNVTSGTTYAVIYNLTFSTGVPFSAKDNSESDLDGQIIRLNSAGGIYEVSTEPSDAYFIANGISIQGGSELNISEDMYIQCPGLPDVANTIQAQSITIDNGQVAYVEINRDSSVVTNLTPVVAGIEGVPAQDNVLVIARRRDDQIYVGVNHTIRLEQGECLQLDEAGAGGGSDVNGSVVINNVSTGSMDGEMGRTVGINNPVMDFQNITNVGQISDMLTFDDTTGLFTVTKTGVFIATGSGNSISGTSGAAVQINGVEVSRENGGNTTFDSSATWSGLLVVGETIAFTSTNGGMDMYKFSISGISTEQLTLNGANMTPASIINPVFEVNEHLTGETWIDGRPVYRRVLNFTNNVTTAQLLDTWDPGLTFLDSLRKVSDTEWVLEIHNASGTFNRSTIVYDEITGEVSSENVDGVGRIEAGTNFIFKYVKP